MKKIFAIILTATLLVAALTGCGTSAADPSPTPTELLAGHDFAAAQVAFPLDTVVMTVDGSEVTWGEYFYWLHYWINYVEMYTGVIEDFSALSMLDEEMTQTYAEFFRESALNTIIEYHAIEANTKAAGAEITEADEVAAAELLASDILSVCGEEGTEEDFYQYLEESFASPEIYHYMNRVSFLLKNSFDASYGETGEKVSEEEISAFISENGYMTAKHILIMTVDAEGAELPEDEAAEKLALAEGLVAQLRATADQEALLTLFDELAAEHNEDGGSAYYPAGYCFTPDQMLTEFSEGTAALEEYQVSDPVKTIHGYHIILRLPTTAEDVLMNSDATIGYAAAVTDYNALIESWLTGAEVVWEEDFETYDIGQLFA